MAGPWLFSKMGSEVGAIGKHFILMCLDVCVGIYKSFIHQLLHKFYPPAVWLNALTSVIFLATEMMDRNNPSITRSGVVLDTNNCYSDCFLSDLNRMYLVHVSLVVHLNTDYIIIIAWKIQSAEKLFSARLWDYYQHDRLETGLVHAPSLLLCIIYHLRREVGRERSD